MKSRLVELDDAAVDHIEQYWLGGKTIRNKFRNKFHPILGDSGSKAVHRRRRPPQASSSPDWQAGLRLFGLEIGPQGANMSCLGWQQAGFQTLLY